MTTPSRKECCATKLVPSRYNFLIPLRRGRTLAYNSLSGATAVWDELDVLIFDRLTRGEEIESEAATVSNFLYGGFVVPEGIDEIETVRHQYEASRNDSSRMVLTVAPTLMCNFGCDYCFQGADKPAGLMSSHVQDAIVAFATRTAPAIKRLHVAWYGGEPLLAPTVILALSDRLISMCDIYRIAYDAMIVTNGYNLTPKVAHSLNERGVQTAQVTLDGAARDHDMRRFRLGGGGSYSRIVQNLKAVVDEVPLRISVRINIDTRNKDSILPLIDDLRTRGFSGRKNFGVYFAPIEAITDGCHCVVGACMAKSDYGELETELTRYAYEAGLTALPYPPRFRGICGALKPNGFVILPNGDIHKCWDTVSMPDRKVGSIFETDALRTDERVLRWARWTPFENETCRSCKILPNCVGSCAHKFLNSDQTRGEAASLPCPSWKYNINQRLVLMAERSGAISTGDYQLEKIQTNHLDVCSSSFMKNAQGSSELTSLSHGRNFVLNTAR
jgi:uncharacterized protein